MAITLHEEIASILGGSGREWMTTAELADAVNRRGRYRKRDGSPISPFQVQGRTRNYSNLFDRDGSRVWLRGHNPASAARAPNSDPTRTENSDPPPTIPAAPMQRSSIAGVDELVALLTDPSCRLPAPTWPGSSFLDGPGLYTWWTDASGATDLTKGLGHPIPAGLIYAGQTGGTTVGGVQRLATLRSRIGGNHLRGRVRSSTFRFTLAAVLYSPLGLRADGPRRLSVGSEAKLSAWMLQHLSICAVTVEDRSLVLERERAVLMRLDPPLNLEGMQPTAPRAHLSRMRRDLGRGVA